MRSKLAAMGAAAALLFAAPALAEHVTAFAAASLKEALDEQARRFESDTGNKVVVSYGASNALAKQIEAGAPADLFISADLGWMDYLEQRGLLIPGSRAPLLRNELVLIAPVRSTAALKIARNFGLAAALGADKLALANPDSVPAGKYAKQALQALGVWPGVENHVVRTENVRVALALVARGEAAFGIVYRTDALSEPGVRVVDTFPEATHTPIVYPAALIVQGKSEAGAALLETLRSGQARAIWSQHGFTPQ
jgi:molybdate transport system substrate-binding protein